MGKVRYHAPRDVLFLDFRFAGKRCREYTALQDTPLNRRKLERLAANDPFRIRA